MKLTSSQKAFLESLRERRLDGQWAWCECFKDEWRTAKSLERRGLVEIMPGDVAEADFFEARLIESHRRQSGNVIRRFVQFRQKTSPSSCQ